MSTFSKINFRALFFLELPHHYSKIVYMYSLKSSSNYHVDVPSHKEILIVS
jgi:hypothetical protein